MTKQALGRGLSTLIPARSSAHAFSSLNPQEVTPSNLLATTAMAPNPFQPRRSSTPPNLRNSLNLFELTALSNPSLFERRPTDIKLLQESAVGGPPNSWA